MISTGFFSNRESVFSIRSFLTANSMSKTN